MYDRKHIERVLKINGLTVDSSDDEIRAIFGGAKYREDEIDQVIRVLRENVAPASEEDVLLASKIMRTDRSLSASEVSKLLGIDVPVQALAAVQREKVDRLTGLHVIIITVLSLMVAGIGLGLAMYAQGFGVFYNEDNEEYVAD